jgi:hypothetical protein
MVNAPADLAGYRGHLVRALDLIERRAPDYLRGKEYYDGTRAEVAASAAVQAIIEKSAQAAPISLAHIPVDVITDKVELASIAAAAEPAKSALGAVVEKNDLTDEADDYLRKAGYFGDYYAIVDPTEESEDGAILADGITVIGSSPLSTVMVYDSKDGRTKLYGAKVWRVGPKGSEYDKALLYYDDATIKLRSPQGDTSRDADKFVPDLDEGEEQGDERMPHPGGRMLLVHLSIDGKPYGTPLHRKAWGPQDAITKVSATNLVNVDGLGLPARYALLDPLAEIDDDIDDDFGTAGPDTTGAAPSDGQTTITADKTRTRSVPGMINLLRGVKSVGQFDAAGSDNFLKNLDWYVRVMAVATGVALFEFDMTGEQPSGESRRRAESRSNRKAAKVKRQAGAFFEELADTVLALLGIESEVEATFNPSETSTDKEGIELVASKIATGIPIPQALREAGYTDEQVDEWFPEGKPWITPASLTALATALQQLGQAKTLGVITDEELRELLPTILTAARGEALAPVAAVVPPAEAVA